MDKLWLYEENETEFVADESKLKEKANQILENKKLIEKIVKENGVSSSEEERFEVMSGISSVLLENKEIRDEMPPYQELSENNLNIMSGFFKASELLNDMLKKEPYLYTDMLPFLQRCLVEVDENIADRDKGKFRDAYSDTIQIGYFTPTKGEDVRKEMNLALCHYGYVDKKSPEQEAILKNFINTAKLHAQIVRIQPFMDGNKRIAFLTTNAMLQLSGLAPIILCETDADQEKYTTALKTAIVGRDVTLLADHIMDNELKRQQSILDRQIVKKLHDKISTDSSELKR